jgi:hypothetical protein
LTGGPCSEVKNENAFKMVVFVGKWMLGQNKDSLSQKKILLKLF